MVDGETISRAGERIAAAVATGALCGEDRVGRFLRQAGYADPDGKLAIDRSLAGNAVSLMRFAGRLDFVFMAVLPGLSGASFFGASRLLGAPALAVARPGASQRASYGAAGWSARAAFEACIGEAAEHDALHRRPGERRGERGPRLVGDRLRHGSSGFAAGPDFASACRAALLEAVERDRLARWFIDGAPPRRIEPDSALAAIVATARRGAAPVRFLLLGPAGSPVSVVVALSEAARPVAGYGAGRTHREAMLKALAELGQGELGLSLELASAKGDDGPFQKRAQMLLARPDLCSGERLTASIAAPVAPLTAQEIARQLGIAITVADLTAPDAGIPVAHVASASLRDIALELEPGETGPL